MNRSNLEYFIKKEDIDVNKLHCIGRMSLKRYFQHLKRELSSISLNIEPIDQGSSLLKMHIQDKHPIEIDNRKFLAALISQPYPSEKKSKPSGLAFEDYSYLQMNEILLYDMKSKVLFLYEYSYHYGIWDYDRNQEVYNFRYDREVLLANPPKKNVEHFHVLYSDPHFHSDIVNLQFILKFIKDNWDTKLNKFYIKELVC